MMNDSYKEVGSGVRTGVYTSGGNDFNAVFTGNDFGSKAGNSFLTGVVITDTTVANSFYNVGEGLSGVTVSVSNGSTTVNTTTNGGGGYQIQLAPGTYNVTFSGPGISTPVTKSVTIGSLNVKVDLNVRTDVPTAPTVSFAAATHSVNEAAGTRTITVNLSKVGTSTITVNYATSSGTATSGSDFTATSGTLTFAPGITSQTFDVPITNDLTLEPTESFNLTLPARAEPRWEPLRPPPSRSSTTMCPPCRSSSLPSRSPSRPPVPRSTSFSMGPRRRRSRQLRSDRRHSHAGDRLHPGCGTLTFAPGTTTRTLNFTVLNDTKDENDETVIITLSSPTNATLGAANQATYTILDNDAAPVPSSPSRLRPAVRPARRPSWNPQARCRSRSFCRLRPIARSPSTSAL